MNILDTRTIMIGYLITNALSAIVMTSLWRQNRHLPGLSFWLADFVLQFVGIMLITLRGSVPDFLSMTVSNTLIIGGTLLLFIGLGIYTDRVSGQLPNYFGLAVFFAIQTYFTLAQPSLQFRNVNIAVFIMLFSIQPAWLLLRRADSQMRKDALSTGLILTGVGILSIIRIVVDLSIHPGNDFFKSGYYDGIILITYQTLYVSLTFSLFLMVNRRLRSLLESDIAERKMAEAALKKSEEKFSVAFHNIPDALVITSIADGLIIEVSESFSRIAGFTAEESIGRTTLALNLWGDLADREHLVEQLERHGRVLSFETKFRRKSGELFTGWISSELIQLQGLTCALNVIQDVTARKQIEDALKESEANFRALVENAGEGILIADKGGAHRFANQAIAEITGYNVAELLDLKVQELSHPDETAKVTKRLQQRLAGELVPTQYETAILSKDGRKVPIEISSNETTWQGQPAAIVFVKDITERQQAEATVRSLARFPAENPNPVLRFAQDEKLLYANQAAFAQLKDWKLAQGALVPEALQAAIRAVYETQAARTIEVSCGERLFSIAIAPVVGNEYVNLYGLDITERQQTEEALKQSTRRFEALLSQAPFTGVIYRLIRDEAGNITDWEISDINALGAASIGLTVETAIGKRALELFGEKAMAPYFEIARQVVASGQPQIFETYFAANDRHYLASVFMLDSDHYANMSVDITARKRAEATLCDSETNLSALIENTDGSIWAVDKNYGLIVGNEEFHRNVSAALGRRLERIESVLLPSFPPEVNAEWQGYYNRALQGEHFAIETATHFRDTPHYIEYRFSPIREANREIRGVTVFGRDITVRKQAEAALLQVSERLALAQHLAGAGVWDWDIAANKLNWSPEFFEIFGLDPAKSPATFDTWRSVLHPDDLQRAEQHISDSIRDHVPLFNEYRIVKLSGETRWIGAWGDTTYDERGEAQRMTGLSIDITARKQADEFLKTYAERLQTEVEQRTRELRTAQEKLVRQERLATLGQLAGSIGHELRNPLGVISNAVYYLKMSQPEASDKVREYLEIIDNETRASDKIVTDLLDFTRLKSVNWGPAAAPELVAQTLKRYPAPPLVQVALEFPADLPQIYADPQHILQVLGNLVVNAYQAMISASPAGTPGDMKLTISAAAQSDMISIDIRDTGVGIPPENMGKLFEPLFTTKTKGIGLGLAVSQKLIEANGGRIAAQSEPGKGSTFTLVLPVYK